MICSSCKNNVNQFIMKKQKVIINHVLNAEIKRIQETSKYQQKQLLNNIMYQQNQAPNNHKHHF